MDSDLTEWFAIVSPLEACQKLVIGYGENATLHPDFQESLKSPALMGEAENAFWDIQAAVDEVLKYKIYHSIEELRADANQAAARLEAFFEEYFAPAIAEELKAYAAAYRINLPPFD